MRMEERSSKIPYVYKNLAIAAAGLGLALALVLDYLPGFQDFSKILVIGVGVAALLFSGFFTYFRR